MGKSAQDSITHQRLPGRFKKSDVGSPAQPGVKHAIPVARPQPFLHAERTLNT
jgi:hypothetical protein